MYPSRKTVARRNAKNYQDTKHAKVVKKWQVKDGVCELSQKPSGKWLAEFTSDDKEEYIVAQANTPKGALKRLQIETTPITTA